MLSAWKKREENQTVEESSFAVNKIVLIDQRKFRSCLIRSDKTINESSFHPKSTTYNGTHTVSNWKQNEINQRASNGFICGTYCFKRGHFRNMSLLYVYHACWGNLGMQTKDLSLKLWSDQICTKGEYQNNLITIMETWELLRISDTQDIPQKNYNKWMIDFLTRHLESLKRFLPLSTKFFLLIWERKSLFDEKNLTFLIKHWFSILFDARYYSFTYRNGDISLCFAGSISPCFLNRRS